MRHAQVLNSPDLNVLTIDDTFISLEQRVPNKGRQQVATCKRCGTENLVWRQSKKGNWYLAEPKEISTKSAYKYITIPFAHKCVEVETYERNESFLFDLQSRSGA